MIWIVIKSLIKLQKILKTSQQNNPKTIINGHDKEISKERFAFPEKRHSMIMENQKIINLLNKTSNQPSKFKTKIRLK